MLTPLDIHNREFKRSLRGYDVDEVDEFLDEVIKDFETLYKENLDLKERMQKQQEHINRYREMEETLQNTMVMAQKLAEEARHNAEKETELLIWEARKKAEQIVSGAHDQVSESARKLEQLKLFEKQFKAKLKGFLIAHLQMVDSNDINMPDSDKINNSEIEETTQEKRENIKNVFMEDNGDE